MCTASRTGTMPYSDTTMTRSPLRFCLLDQLAGDGVDVAQILGQAGIVRVGSPLLQAVVEMRQVAERQRRLPRAADVQRGARDPAARLDRGHRPPEAEQREGAERAVELVAQLGRLGIVVRNLAPVGRIHRPRRRADVDGGIHIVPPEHVGAGEGGVASACPPPRPSRPRSDGWIAAKATLRPARGSTSRWPRRHGRREGGRSAASTARCR